jgi:hypothetical protein
MVRRRNKKNAKDSIAPLAVLSIKTRLDGGLRIHVEQKRARGEDDALDAVGDLLNSSSQWLAFKRAQKRESRCDVPSTLTKGQSYASDISKEGAEPLAPPSETSPNFPKCLKLSKEEKEFLETVGGEAARFRDALELVSDGVEPGGLLPLPPLRLRVATSNLPVDVRRQMNQKLVAIGETSACSESVKYISWVEACLEVPLGVIAIPAVPANQLAQTLRCVRDQLESVVYGHQAAKQAVLERTFLWLSNPSAPQRPLAFCGPPGTGKTTLARHGLALGVGRSFHFLTLGGALDSSMLIGHHYTYEGSRPGQIAACLQKARCMNPVIYFDELDKVSATAKGEEVSNVLVHLTDGSQNDAFADRYLQGIELDLSRALLVFSLNDSQNVPAVLRDRIQIVHTEEIDATGQRKIVENFLVPQALQRIGVPPSFLSFTENAVEALQRKMAGGCGVREVSRLVDDLVTKVLIWDVCRDASLCAPLAAESHITEVALRTFVANRAAVDAICAESGTQQNQTCLMLYS